jgi:hypothetical protein
LTSKKANQLGLSTPWQRLEKATDRGARALTHYFSLCPQFIFTGIIKNAFFLPMQRSLRDLDGCTCPPKDGSRSLGIAMYDFQLFLN